MNMTQEFVSRASQEYEELAEGSLKYREIFNKYLWEYAVRRDAFSQIRLFIITDNEKISKFMQVVNGRKSEKFQREVEVLTLFHGPNFQEDRCQFDFSRHMCSGHENNLVCFTENPLYSFCNQDRRTMDTRIGYIILCKVMLTAGKLRDPESTSPFHNYLQQGWDTIFDYGNNKLFKVMSNEVLPYCLIQYRRKYNVRLDNPNYQVFEAESIEPAPEVSYEEIDYTSIEFLNLKINLPSGKILSVKKIINPYLENKYREVKERYYPNAEVIQVCHGTTFECADLIAQYNLDWRKCCYGKYGWGVHFARFANYAKYFPLHNCCKTLPDGPKKCMIIFDMLYDQERLYQVGMEEVNEKLSGMIQPPEGYNGVHVWYEKYVKFNDNEFLPKYIIIYENN